MHGAQDNNPSATNPTVSPPFFVTLGMFIIDEFRYLTEHGDPTGRTAEPQIGGGGTYAAIGARVWLSPKDIGMIVDKGCDFPLSMQSKLLAYGPEMWLFREREDNITTRARNSYRGELRSFEYLNPRLRITPRDLCGTELENTKSLHFICSPSRALEIIAEIREISGWKPLTIYEPIPDRCIPEELPSLIKALPFLCVLSPNAEEAHSLLSLPLPVTKESIKEAATQLLDYGIGQGNTGAVIIRSGHMGSYVATRNAGGLWVEAFWSGTDARVVDVTGAGNSFLGGLAAGLKLTGGDIYEATLFASVSASFTIEQAGLPSLSDPVQSQWNGDNPQKRLEELRTRVGSRPHYVCTQ